VGAIEEKPVVLNGQIAVRHRMRLTGSFDHRIIDGAMGAKFLQEIKKILENPVQLCCSRYVSGSPRRPSRALRFRGRSFLFLLPYLFS